MPGPSEPSARSGRSARVDRSAGSAGSSRGAHRGAARVRRAGRGVGVAVVVLLAVVGALAGVTRVSPVAAAFTGSTQAEIDVAAASSFYVGTVLEDAPVGYWRLGDSNGTTAAAVTGTAGTYEGEGFTRGVTGTTRDGDTALGLPPVLGRVSMPRLVQDDLSVKVWFATTVAAGSSAQWWAATPLVDADHNGGTDDFGVSLSGDGRVVAGVGTLGGPDTSITSGPGLADGAWHHVVFTREQAGGELALWVDGVQVATGTAGTTSLTGSATMAVGELANWDWHTFTGAIDELAVYPSVLSGATTAAHHAAASGTGYAAAVAADSPAGHWRLGETSGTAAAAVVGGTGAYDPAAHPVEGATGDGDRAQHFGWGFTGGRQALTVRLPRDVSGSFSLECWFRATAGTSTSLNWFDGAALLGADASGAGGDFGVTLDADGRVMAGTGQPDTTIHSGVGFADDQWHHVVFTRDGATGAMTLYVDGTPRDTATGTTAPLTTTPHIYVGRQPDGTGTFTGAVDDVAVYPTVLPPARVLLHHRRGTGP